MDNRLLALIPVLPFIGFLLNSIIALASARKNKLTHIEESHGHDAHDAHDSHAHASGPYWLPSIIGCLFPSLSFALCVWAFCTLKANPEMAVLSTGPLFSWMPVHLFQISFGFAVDHLASVMLLVVTGVGSLIHFYSTGYMKGDPAYARYFSYLNLFLFFMLLLVLGDNLLVLFVGWEGVGLASYLLIGFWFTDPEKAAAGKKAFVVNRIGDFGFLIGLFLIISAFADKMPGMDYFSYSFLAANHSLIAPSLITVITLCLFVCATGKSAQIPLYVWLPDAMAGPTPVSALIHAATMVTAGIYMVAKLYFLFLLAPATLHVIAVIGIATALMAALIAITQYDIKKVLAYSTVSQLGYMFLALGSGAPQSAIFHVVTHAFFKACLFLCAGSVIYAMHHEQDIRKMGGLFKKVPSTAIAFLVSNLAIAGIPPFSGFFSKDEILWNTYLHLGPVFYGLAFFTAGLTAFYMFRLFTYTFLGKGRYHHDPIRVPMVMQVPVIILAVLAAVGGFMGVPEVLGGHNHFHHWLAALTPAAEHAGDHHALEMTLMGASTVWAICMSGLAVFLYSRNLEWTRSLKSNLSWLHSLLSNKFYVDEIYRAVIVRPIYFLSHCFLWKTADVKVIDGVLIHGWTDAAKLGAKAISKLQSGLLGHYLVYFWAALILLMVYVTR